MLTFNLKKEWFEKIKSGEKMHEYREVKPYWTKRLFKDADYDINDCGFIAIRDWKHLEIYFACGYPSISLNNSDKWLYARIVRISKINGKNTDLAIDKDVYDIEFELLEE